MDFFLLPLASGLLTLLERYAIFPCHFRDVSYTFVMVYCNSDKISNLIAHFRNFQNLIWFSLLSTKLTYCRLKDFTKSMLQPKTYSIKFVYHYREPISEQFLWEIWRAHEDVFITKVGCIMRATCSSVVPQMRPFWSAKDCNCEYV